MSKFATITVDTDGVAVTESAPCRCVCSTLHPRQPGACTLNAAEGSLRCDACTAATAPVERELVRSGRIVKGPKSKKTGRIRRSDRRPVEVAAA
jgi:hypothetical protein